MNIRKNIDYTDMYAALNSAMAKNESQVELYYEIGRAVCQRTEKGAAVAAATYLSEHYPDVQGFSPRNLRRMRDFYRTYENYPSILTVAMQVGWTQNVVIMEATLTIEEQEWYLKAVRHFGWSKAELMAGIASGAHEKLMLDIREEMCDNENISIRGDRIKVVAKNIVQYDMRFLLRRCQRKPKRSVITWLTMYWHFVGEIYNYDMLIKALVRLLLEVRLRLGRREKNDRFRRAKANRREVSIGERIVYTGAIWRFPQHGFE